MLDIILRAKMKYIKGGLIVINRHSGMDDIIVEEEWTISLGDGFKRLRLRDFGWISNREFHKYFRWKNL